MEILDWFLKALGVGVGCALGFIVIVEIATRYQRRSIDRRMDELLRLREILLKENANGNDQ